MAAGQRPPGSHVCIGASAVLPRAECKGWQAFFDSLNGNDWRNCTETRNNPCNCVSWNPYRQFLDAAVNCSSGHITRISFGGGDRTGGSIGNNLVGSIPPEIGLLSELDYLSLHTNKLSGAIPSEIGKLAKLRKLWLFGNYLTGSIPDTLATLNELTVLSVYGNDLTGQVPSLPFQNYTGDCKLDTPPNFPGIEHNHFSCPLPANALKFCVAKCS
jgi:hypothetical protein